MRNEGATVRIARYHNIFGPEGTFEGGREKAPAAFCRKVAAASDGDTVEVWGDGEQSRSFLYIDECVEGTRRLMDADCAEPLNIGSSELVTINTMMEMVIARSGKRLSIRHVDGPQGVRGRVSDNTQIQERLGWQPRAALRDGLAPTYDWIAARVAQQVRA